MPTELFEPFGNLLEPMATLSFLAGHAQRIRLGTSILVLPQRNPLLVAKQAATIHHLSGGRFILSIGVGWAVREYELLRVDFRARGELADEYVDAIRTLFDSDSPVHHGANVDFHNVAFAPRPTTPIPIVVGGNSKAALRRAAQRGDGWHALGLEPDQVAGGAAEIKSFGHRPQFEISLRIGMRVTSGSETTGALHGTPEKIIAKIRSYEQAGVQHLVIDPDSNNVGDFIKQLQSFATEVKPDLP
jgi:probable F420-dependent oxidoreductase